MKVRVTIIKILDDDIWGFQEMYDEGKSDGLSDDEIRACIKELIQEDVTEVLDDAVWKLELYPQPNDDDTQGLFIDEGRE